MKDYSDPKYKDLYAEILKDYHYRFPKYQPIPYPLLRKDLTQTNNNRNSL